MNCFKWLNIINTVWIWYVRSLEDGMNLYLFMKSNSVVVLHVHRKTICQQFVILDNRSHWKKENKCLPFRQKLENFTPCAFQLIFNKSFTLKFVFQITHSFAIWELNIWFQSRKRQLKAIDHKKSKYRFISFVNLWKTDW